MAGVSTEQSESKLNTELNLVPFIDLLSSLVLFLLVTAVWLQVAAIPASLKSKGMSSSVSETGKHLFIRVTSKGYMLEWPHSLAHARPRLIAKATSGYDRARLTSVVKDALKAQPLLSATVSGDDSVDYGTVIDTIDAARSSGSISVALNPN
jgi:biopolymer transport protein ExbD